MAYARLGRLKLIKGTAKMWLYTMDADVQSVGISTRGLAGHMLSGLYAMTGF